jgi:hypothetical protein
MKRKDADIELSFEYDFEKIGKEFIHGGSMETADSIGERIADHIYELRDDEYMILVLDSNEHSKLTDILATMIVILTVVEAA